QDAADPITKGRQKAHIIAEPRLGVREDAGVDIRAPLSQKLEHAAQRVHACAGDSPSDDGAEGSGCRRETAWQVEDAGADHRADAHGCQRGPRQFLQLLRCRCLCRCRCAQRTLLGFHWNVPPYISWIELSRSLCPHPPDALCEPSPECDLGASAVLAGAVLLFARKDALYPLSSGASGM